MSEDEMRKEENLEHEVLDRLKNLEPMDFDYNAVDATYVDAVLKARNIIFDLYQKEKEKNKELNQALMNKTLKMNIITGAIAQNDYISKDKIREKIKELEENVKEFEEYWSKDPRKFKRTKSIDYYKLEALKELLEENNNEM